MSKNFTKYLNDKLAETGLSQADVARRSGGELLPQYVSQVSRGKVKTPKPEKLPAFAIALGVSLEEVLAAAGLKNLPTDFEKKVLGAVSPAQKWTRDEQNYLLSVIETLVAGIDAKK